MSKIDVKTRPDGNKSSYEVSHTQCDSKNRKKLELDKYPPSLTEPHDLTPLHNKAVHLLRSLEGKTINITTVYVDIVNSTQQVKTISIEEAGKYYRTFIETVSDQIQEHGGYVLKNVGDCVIGFFPSSIHYVENHDKAISCGLAIRDAIKDSLNSNFLTAKLPSISCRISADFGTVKVIGIRSNGDYSIIDLFGGAMNSSAKILYSAMPNQMVIGENLFWEARHFENLYFKLIRRWDFLGTQTYPVYLVERMELYK